MPFCCSDGSTHTLSIDVADVDYGEDAKNTGIASDGTFLYVSNSKGIYKFGTGLHNTVKGHLYRSSDTRLAATSRHEFYYQ